MRKTSGRENQGTKMDFSTLSVMATIPPVVLALNAPAHLFSCQRYILSGGSGSVESPAQEAGADKKERKELACYQDTEPDKGQHSPTLPDL